MKLLIFSDTHEDTAALVQLMQTEADLYFAAGDDSCRLGWEPVFSSWPDRSRLYPGRPKT